MTDEARREISTFALEVVAAILGIAGFVAAAGFFAAMAV